MVRTFRRRSSSRTISPASMVFPSPVSSAMKRLTRGSSNAFRNGSIWYASILMPARNGAWKSDGSVAVVQLHRNVFRKAAKWSGESKPRFPRSDHGSSSRDGAVELVFPEDFELPALGVVVRAGEADAGGFVGVVGRNDLFDQPVAGADSHHFADARVAFGEVGVGGGEGRGQGVGGWWG